MPDDEPEDAGELRPVGLLAWIAEKFTEWADPRSTITLDQILAEVSIYWFTATAGSSAASRTRLARKSPLRRRRRATSAGPK